MSLEFFGSLLVIEQGNGMLRVDVGIIASKRCFDEG
jgi:hypothetical protein